MIVPVAMDLLNDRLRFHAAEVGQLPDLGSIRAGETGTGADVNGAGAARGHHGGLGSDQLGQARANLVVHFLQQHVMAGCIRHSLVQLGPDFRGSENRMRAAAVDDRPDPEPVIDVHRGIRGRGPLRERQQPQ